jgi:hypothetical protein
MRMTILTNPKYERMAQSLAEGKTSKQSYIDAGFAPANARSGASSYSKQIPPTFNARVNYCSSVSKRSERW